MLKLSLILLNNYFIELTSQYLSNKKNLKTYICSRFLTFEDVQYYCTFDLSSLCVYVIAIPKDDYYEYYLELLDIKTLKTLDFILVSTTFRTEFYIYTWPETTKSKLTSGNFSIGVVRNCLGYDWFTIVCNEQGSYKLCRVNT